MNVWEALFQFALLLFAIFSLAVFWNLVIEVMKGYSVLLTEFGHFLINFAAWCKRNFDEVRFTFFAR